MQGTMTAIVERMSPACKRGLRRFCCAAAVFFLPLQIQAAELRISDTSGLTRLLSTVTGPADISIIFAERRAAQKVELESADGLGDSVRAERSDENTFIARSVEPGRYILQVTPPDMTIDSIEISR